MKKLFNETEWDRVHLSNTVMVLPLVLIFMIILVQTA